MNLFSHCSSCLMTLRQDRKHALFPGIAKSPLCDLNMYPTIVFVHEHVRQLISTI